MIGWLQVISVSRNFLNKENKTLPFRQRQNHNLKNPYPTSQQEVAIF